MRTIVADKIRQVDYLFNKAYLKLFGERKSLVIFIFHVLFRDKEELNANIVHPLQGITLEGFRKFV